MKPADSPLKRTLAFCGIIIAPLFRRDYLFKKMTTISLKSACKLIDNAIALYLDSEDQQVTYNFCGVPDDMEDEFLKLEWSDDEGNIFEVLFSAKNNQEVQIDEKQMFLISDEDDKEAISLVFEYANLVDEISKLK